MRRTNGNIRRNSEIRRDRLLFGHKNFKIKKILVPTDFSRTANNALSQAINMARMSGAVLKLYYVIVPILSYEGPMPIPQGDLFYVRLRRNLLNRFKRIAADISKANKIKVIYEVGYGNVSSEICELAEKQRFDIILMGTHGTSGISEFFVGSNAAKVVANAPCPVITVQKRPSKKGFRNIILPIRLERSSRQKVDYVVEIAKLFDSTVHITGFTSEKDPVAKGRVTQYVDQVHKYLSSLKIKNKSSVIFADNFTKEMIGHAERCSADLIAIMNDNQFSLDQLIKGPYAKQFVNHSPIPVMGVPVYSDPDLLEYTPYLSGALPA